MALIELENHIFQTEVKGGHKEKFDDYNSHVRKEIETGNKVRVSSIEIQAGHLVYGIATTYEIYDKKTEKTKKIVIKHKGTCVDKTEFYTLDLDADEEFTGIIGSAGEIVDCLTFVTSKRRMVKAGGSGGDKFKMAPPKGMRLIALGGSNDKYLHSFYAYFGV